MGKLNVSFKTAAVLWVATLTACGQGPSFIDAATGNGKGGSGSSETKAAAPGGDGSSGGGADAGNGGSGTGGSTAGGGSGGGGSGGGGSGGGGNGGTDFEIPGADPSDVPTIQRCLAKWKNLPFGKTITNYKRIYAAVTVGGVGVAVNDTQQTAEPQLVLIYASVNVGGSPTYNLRNDNGYYCVKVGVNVNTNLTVNLACNARLADSLVQVDVGSTSNTTTANIGVNVGSNIKVQTVQANNQACAK